MVRLNFSVTRASMMMRNHKKNLQCTKMLLMKVVFLVLTETLWFKDSLPQPKAICFRISKMLSTTRITLTEPLKSSSLIEVQDLMSKISEGALSHLSHPILLKIWSETLRKAVSKNRNPLHLWSSKREERILLSHQQPSKQWEKLLVNKSVGW